MTMIMIIILGRLYDAVTKGKIFRILKSHDFHILKRHKQKVCNLLFQVGVGRMIKESGKYK